MISPLCPSFRFFLDWYSGSLMRHGDRLMAAARRVFGPAASTSARANTGPLTTISGPGSDASINTDALSIQHQAQISEAQLRPQLSAIQIGGGSGGTLSSVASSGGGATGGLGSGASLSSPLVHASGVLDPRSMSALGGLFDGDPSESSMSLVVGGDLGSQRSSSRNMSSGRVSAEVAREGAGAPASYEEYRPAADAHVGCSSIAETCVRPSCISAALTVLSGRELVGADDSSGCTTPDGAATCSAAEAADELLAPGLRMGSGAATCSAPGSAPAAGASGVGGSRMGSCSEPDLRHRLLTRGSEPHQPALTLKIAGIQ